jgi:hypothetical protein
MNITIQPADSCLIIGDENGEAASEYTEWLDRYTLQLYRTLGTKPSLVNLSYRTYSPDFMFMNGKHVDLFERRFCFNSP